MPAHRTWSLEGTMETIHPFNDVVTAEADVRALIGEPGERALKKEIAAIDRFARAFIEHSPFLLLATAGANGRCDVSPKGDAPGFVRVLDERRLAIPDRPGNKRLDGMRNILENGHAGIIFLIPGREDTLRINGRAWLTRDRELLESMAVGIKTPQIAIGVEVEECYFHCPKSFKRSKLWHHAEWPAADNVPPFAEMLFGRTHMGESADAIACELEERWRSLY